MKSFLVALTLAAGLLTAPAGAAAVVAPPQVRTFEVAPVGSVPTGCTTPAGKAAAVVSAGESGRSLVVDDRSASAHTVVVCRSIRARPPQCGSRCTRTAYRTAS